MMSSIRDRRSANVSVEVRAEAATTIPSIDASITLQLLPAVLSLIAGSTDIISFIGLNGLFTAHITGNLAILAAHLATGEKAQLAVMLSVPMFMAVLGIAKVMAGVIESSGVASLQPLLLIQFILLAGFLYLCVPLGSRIDLDATGTVVAGMLGVSAMAVQAALVQVSLKDSPSTVVMTTNITRFMMDIGELLRGRDASKIAIARTRARHTWPAIVAFAAGCAFGAIAQILLGLWSLALPTGLAFVAFGMALVDASTRRGAQCRFSKWPSRQQGL